MAEPGSDTLTGELWGAGVNKLKQRERSRESRDEAKETRKENGTWKAITSYTDFREGKGGKKERGANVKPYF